MVDDRGKEGTVPSQAHNSNQKTLFQNHLNPSSKMFQFLVFKAQNHHLEWLPERVSSHRSRRPLLEWSLLSLMRLVSLRPLLQLLSANPAMTLTSPSFPPFKKQLWLLLLKELHLQLLSLPSRRERKLIRFPYPRQLLRPWNRGWPSTRKAASQHRRKGRAPVKEEWVGLWSSMRKPSEPTRPESRSTTPICQHLLASHRFLLQLLGLPSWRERKLILRFPFPRQLLRPWNRGWPSTRKAASQHRRKGRAPVKEEWVGLWSSMRKPSEPTRPESRSTTPICQHLLASHRFLLQHTPNQFDEHHQSQHSPCQSEQRHPRPQGHFFSPSREKNANYNDCNFQFFIGFATVVKILPWLYSIITTIIQCYILFAPILVR